MNLQLTQAEESNEKDLSKIMPVYGSDKAACFDIKADIMNRSLLVKGNCNDPVSLVDTIIDVRLQGFFNLLPQQRVLIPTGFIFGIPEGFRMNLVSRSGLTWKSGVIVLNAPAVIDEDYNQETFVLIYNSSAEPFTIEHGMRICQAEINPVYRVELESLGGRDGGFGSTGKK